MQSFLSYFYGLRALILYLPVHLYNNFLFFFAVHISCLLSSDSQFIDSEPPEMRLLLMLLAVSSAAASDFNLFITATCDPGCIIAVQHEAQDEFYSDGRPNSIVRPCEGPLPEVNFKIESFHNFSFETTTYEFTWISHKNKTFYFQRDGIFIVGHYFCPEQVSVLSSPSQLFVTSAIVAHSTTFVPTTRSKSIGCASDSFSQESSSSSGWVAWARHFTNIWNEDCEGLAKSCLWTTISWLWQGNQQ